MENKIILSICVLGVLNRLQFLNKFLSTLYKQTSTFNDVEVLFLLDNKKSTIGTKRQQLLNQAKGEFIVFIDDDDVISDNYVAKIRETCIDNLETDIITYLVSVSINNGPYKLCKYSLYNAKDYNTNTTYYRIPNHICVVKTDIAKSIGYKDISFGEDSDYAKRLLPKLKRECSINEVLYMYNYNQQTSESNK